MHSTKQYKQRRGSKKRLLALLLAVVMVMTSVSLPGGTAEAAKKKPKVTAVKETDVAIGKTATISVKTKNVKKIKSVKATSSKKSVIKVTKTKKSKKGAKVTVKALKVNTAKVKITVKYIPVGSKKAKTKKLTVKVTGKSPAVKPTPQPTKKPVNPSPTPTNKPTTNPTDDKASITGLKIVRMNEAIQVSFNKAVELQESDFVVTRKPYKSSEWKNCNIEYCERVSTQSYSLSVSVSAGDTVKVSIPSLQGATKEMSVVAKSMYDGTTEKQTIGITESGSTISTDLANASERYDLIGEVTIGKADEEWPTWFSLVKEKVQYEWDDEDEYDAWCIKIGDLPAAGSYKVPVKLTDEIGSVIIVVYEIMVATGDSIILSEEAVQINHRAGMLWQTEINTIMGGIPEDGDLTYEDFDITVTQLTGEKQDINVYIWNEGQYGTICVEGEDWIASDATYEVIIKPTSDSTISARFTISIKVLKPVKVSGKVTNAEGKPLDSAKIIFQNVDDSEDWEWIWPDEDGTYEWEAFPGTYSVFAELSVGSKTYYCNKDNLTITENSKPVTNYNFQFDVAPRRVWISVSDQSNVEISGVKVSDENMIRYMGWYDEDGKSVGTVSMLMPGEYKLHCPEVWVYPVGETNDESGNFKVCSASVSFTVADEDVDAQAVISVFKPNIIASVSDSNKKAEFSRGALNGGVLKFTVPANGYYRLGIIGKEDASAEEENCSFLMKLLDENFNVINRNGDEYYSSYIGEFEAGKNYYFYDTRLAGTYAQYYATLTKAESVTVSGKIVDVSNNENFTFEEGKLPRVIFTNRAGLRFEGTVGTNGTYSVSVLGGTDYEIEYQMPNGYKLRNGTISIDSGDQELMDLPIYKVKVVLEEEYQQYTCEFEDWYDESGWSNYGKGDELYLPYFYYIGELHTKCTVQKDGQTEEFYATINPSEDEATVTATLSHWLPTEDDIVELTENTISEPYREKWFSFVPEEDGYYIIEIADATDPSEKDIMDPVCDKFNFRIQSEVQYDADGDYEWVYPLKAGQTYYMHMDPWWSPNSYTALVKKYNAVTQ